MNLNDAQKQTVSAWIAEGLKLSDIQKRLGTEFGLNVTYMEVRLLVDDLKLMPKDAPAPAEKTLAAPAAALPPAPSATHNLDQAPLESPLPLADDAGTAGLGGKVSVQVDTVTRPGSLVSGSVTFSDGQGGTWYLDQMGRLGVAPKQQGYKPSAADVQAFQQALEAELSKIGF